MAVIISGDWLRSNRLHRCQRGRPSTYGLERCGEIVAIMRQGFSMTAAAGAMGVHRDTLYSWTRTHPEFSDALQLAKTLRVLKLETDLLTASDAVTVRRCITALKSADPEEWNRPGVPRNQVVLARQAITRVTIAATAQWTLKNQTGNVHRSQPRRRAKAKQNGHK